MHALIKREYPVYFGGSYTENWSEDYKLSVAYWDRREVQASYNGTSWQAVGGDCQLTALLNCEKCPALTRQYFDAAATAYAAVQECLRRGLGLDRLAEFFHSSGNPLTAPELMRLLMDDWGFSMELSYQVTAHCCADIHVSGVNVEEVYRLQPRTAHIVSLLRTAAKELLSVSYDARRRDCRSLAGAGVCGEPLRLAFHVLGGRIRKASALVYGAKERWEYPMEREGDCYAVNFSLPEEAQAMWYSFCIETERSTQWLCADETGFIGRLCAREEQAFRLTVGRKDFSTPLWFCHSVMYQIFPDRFAFSQDGTAEKGIAYHEALGQTPQLHASLTEPVRWQPRDFEESYSPDDFYGGTFRGMEEKLPYLKSLGVSCLYLNPIVEARSNHRYDCSDYLRPDPILGSMEDFNRLIKAAGEQGIRVILDGVFSHTGADSIYFNRYGNYPGKGAFQSEDSPYYPWYDFRSFPAEYRCWWGFPDLPEVEETNPVWQDFVVSGENSVVKSWLRQGAAGWRLDVADELPDEVLALIRQAVKEERADAPIIGEVWEDAVTKESYGKRRNYALGYSLDSVMNYPLRREVLRFLRGHSDAYTLRDFLISQQSHYPKPFYYALMNLMGSHDVDRLRSALSVDFDIRALSREEQMKICFTEEALTHALTLEKLAAAIQFALPGVPSIYYGDEQGMCGVCDPFNRQPFQEGERELFGYYCSLSAQRNAWDFLQTGEAQFQAADKDVLLILRYINEQTDALGEAATDGAALTIVNRAPEERFYELDCTVAGCGWISGTVAPYTAETRILR